MAYYLVKAKPKDHLLPELRQRLDSSEIKKMKPFGTALDLGLNGARLIEDYIAIWEDEDYCSPPLAMERAAVLDTYGSPVFNGVEGQKRPKHANETN